MFQSISPGFARTQLARNYPEDHVLQSKLKNTPLTPQHIAEGVVYLLSTPPEIVVCKPNNIYFHSHNFFVIVGYHFGDKSYGREMLK